MASVNNIQAFREARGWSRPHLAKLMETTPQQVERLEKGMRSLRQDWIDRAAAAFGVDPVDIIAPNMSLAAAEDNRVTAQTARHAHNVAPITSAMNEPRTWRVDGGEVVQLQKLDLSLSMGPGTVIDDYVESEPVSIDLAFIRAITRSPPERLKLVSGIGDSMYPTLNWGDVIMIDTTDRALAKQDGIYWIDLYGAAGLKRLRTIGPGRVLVKSDNATVGDQEVDASDLRIEGRAIWVARGL